MKNGEQTIAIVLMAAGVVASFSSLGCGSPEPQGANTLPDATSPDAGATADAEDEEEGDGSSDASSPPPSSGPICSRDGWCWDLPWPQGNDLNAVWASDRSHLYAVGQLGTLLKYDGRSWSHDLLATQDAFRSVWGTGPDDVWAVGDKATIYHFDGGAWSVELPATSGRTPALFGVTGTTKGNVWVVGEGGTILHFDGMRWSNPDSGTTATLRSVVALQADDAWAVGDGGVAVHFDGTKWTLDTKAALVANLFGVHGTSKNDVWAVGAQGTVGHFDGTKWTRTVVDATATFRTVVAESPDSAWIAGDNGAIWRWAISAPSTDGGVTSDASSVDAGSADGGDAGVVRKWVKVPNGTKANFYGSVRLSSDDIGFVGVRGEILRWNAGTWERLARGGTANRLALSAAAADDVWIVGDETLHLGKQGWSPMAAGTDRALYGLSYTKASGGWAVGTAGTIVRLDGADAGAWNVVEGPTTRWLHAIWTSGSSAGWIVGGAGTALALLNGTAWQVVPTGGITVDLLDVWGSAVDDVWAVGQGGTILHWRTNSWALVSNGADGGLTNELRSVWGSGAKDVWAVGAGGIILHYDGLAWSTSASGQAYTLNDVWGTSASDVFAVGTGGTIVHWDGKSWRRQESGTESSLNTVQGAEGRVWAAGENNTILRFTAK